jgi:parvulin-like peptidyl-prolyl isomerase
MPEALGDPTMLPALLNMGSADTVARQFGRMFSDAVVLLEPGAWYGPIRSSYGLHFVYISQKIPARDPDLEEIRPEVAREWSVRQRREFKEQAYQELRSRYTVIVEKEPPQEPDKP